MKMNKPGIYVIFNKITNDFYVGSAGDVDQRIKYHFSYLRRNRHGNTILQRAFNKYGESNFQAALIKRTTSFVSNLLDSEDYYIDYYQPEYNIVMMAYSASGYKHTDASCKKISDWHLQHSLTRGKPSSFKGRHHTDESKRKLSESHKGKTPWNKGKHYSEEQKRNLSEAHKGKHLSEEAKRKVSEWQLKHSPFRGKQRTQAHRQKLREAAILRFSDPEERRRVGAPKIGRPLSEAHKMAIGKAVKGIVRTDEWKRKISESHKMRKKP